MDAYSLGQLFGCGLLCLCPLIVAIVIAVAAGKRGGARHDSGGGGEPPPAKTWQPPQPAPLCGSCGGSGKQSDTCNGGYVYGADGRPQHHHFCGGTGYVRCTSCNGTGHR
ncbi:hypothetical protein AB0M46_11520 [Dactylosporangium sp. NPDC051485]|uniref:hypothetical protein n=1 Tax=Dactylosporangium sp. NPDC051485 TaxID=3154846 RepID=UPI00344821DA